MSEFRRRMMFPSSRLPYDAEVEYIGSTNSGGQAIAANVYYDPTIEIKLRYKATASGIAGYIFGLYLNDGSVRRWALNYRSNRFYPQFNTNTSTNTAVSINTWYDIEADYRYLKVNNNTIDTGVQPFSTAENVNIALFTRWYHTTSNDYADNATTVKSSLISMAQIYTQGIKRRDYISVRVGQTGYLYDKVSNSLFGNVLTGNFIIGDDVNT